MESVKSSPQPSGRARLKVGWEKLSGIAHEMRYLAGRQQAEVGENYLPYAPDWDTYLAYERAGSCVAWTARTIESRVLVGYVIWITTRGLHSVETIFASADLVYLAPEWREGLTGYKLLKSAIAAIQPNVNIVKIETNDLYEDGRMGVLLKRLGFRRIGSVHVLGNW
jgi:hypothetical protein